MKWIDSHLEAFLGALILGLLLAFAGIVWAQEIGALERMFLSLAAQTEPDHPRDSKFHSCTNAWNAAEKCACRKSPGEDGTGCDEDAAEDAKCKEWCHKGHCHCFQPECDS